MSNDIDKSVNRLNAAETIRRQAIALQFQSTLSVRRATHDNGGNHALFQHFNPRSP